MLERCFGGWDLAKGGVCDGDISCGGDAAPSVG